MVKAKFGSPSARARQPIFCAMSNFSLSITRLQKLKAVVAVGIGIFFVFQKPDFSEPKTLLTPDNGSDIQRAEEPSPTVSATKLKPKLKPSVGATLSTDVPSTTATLKELAVARGIRIG
ncbi:MAG: hypothetical protein HYZ73_07210, partial [Elusimicrobia bacterium]|nr:hypothetical protein [Elusimicrobiota bacterium]